MLFLCSVSPVYQMASLHFFSHASGEVGWSTTLVPKYLTNNFVEYHKIWYKHPYTLRMNCNIFDDFLTVPPVPKSHSVQYFDF